MTSQPWLQPTTGRSVKQLQTHWKRMTAREQEHHLTQMATRFQHLLETATQHNTPPPIWMQPDEAYLLLQIVLFGTETIKDDKKETVITALREKQQIVVEHQNQTIKFVFEAAELNLVKHLLEWGHNRLKTEQTRFKLFATQNNNPT